MTEQARHDNHPISSSHWVNPKTKKNWHPHRGILLRRATLHSGGQYDCRLPTTSWVPAVLRSRTTRAASKIFRARRGFLRKARLTGLKGAHKRTCSRFDPNFFRLYLSSHWYPSCSASPPGGLWVRVVPGRY